MKLLSIAALASAGLISFANAVSFNGKIDVLFQGMTNKMICNLYEDGKNSVTFLNFPSSTFPYGCPSMGLSARSQVVVQGARESDGSITVTALDKSMVQFTVIAEKQPFKMMKLLVMNTAFTSIPRSTPTSSVTSMLFGNDATSAKSQTKTWSFGQTDVTGTVIEITLPDSGTSNGKTFNSLAACEQAEWYSWQELAKLEALKQITLADFNTYTHQVYIYIYIALILILILFLLLLFTLTYIYNNL